jgi:hypothetical protein
MLSVEAFMALDALEHGAYFNCSHTIARELIAEGLAQSDWDRLAISEQGRVYLRSRRAAVRQFVRGPADAADLSLHRVIDPMSNPQATPPQAVTPAQLEVLAALEVAPTGMLPPAGKWRDRALRAAGTASGKTDVWPDTVWVMEFINALEKEESDTENQR